MVTHNGVGCNGGGLCNQSYKWRKGGGGNCTKVSAVRMTQVCQPGHCSKCHSVSDKLQGPHNVTLLGVTVDSKQCNADMEKCHVVTCSTALLQAPCKLSNPEGGGWKAFCFDRVCSCDRSDSPRPQATLHSGNSACPCCKRSVLPQSGRKGRGGGAGGCAL